MYNNLTYEQTVHLQMLFTFLRRLKAVGYVETKVVGTHANGYSITIDKYYPGIYKTELEIAMEQLDLLGLAFDDPEDDSQVVS